MSNANADRSDDSRSGPSEALATVERAFRVSAGTAALRPPVPRGAPAAGWVGEADRRRRAAAIGVRARGPAVRPPSPSLAGPLRAGLALVRLPLDLIVAVEYVVQQLPHLVQDVRSLVNSLARLAHDADPGALADVIAGLAAAVDPREGALVRALDAAAELARAQARELDRRRAAAGRSRSSPDENGHAAARR